jgi:hypothetical protein
VQSASRPAFLAYGLTLNGDPSLGRRLLSAQTPNSNDARGPSVTLTWRSTDGDPVPKPWGFSSEHAYLRFSHGLLEAHRATASITISSAVAPDPEAVVHPYLGFPCAAMNRWRGWDALHGGAFLLGGKAYFVSGEREQGKSTLLAALAAAGHSVMADDMVVIDDALQVHVGPRCIDLRPEAHPQFGGDVMTFPSDRGRRRIALGPAPSAMPLGGIVDLAWGPTASIERLQAAAMLSVIDAAQFLPFGPARPASFLDLLGLPAWRFTRPRVPSDVTAMSSVLLDNLR